MGADTKALRTRIKSVDSTLHLTKAMGLVASSKIRRANDLMFQGRQYTEAFASILEILTACPECRKSPFLRKGGSQTRLIVIAGDRGLAGGYNANIFRLAGEYSNAEIIPIGKRACERYRKEVISSEHVSMEDAYWLAVELCEDFAKGKYDRLGIIGTEYCSMMTQEAYVHWILPLEPGTGETHSAAVFEPDEQSILNTVIPEYVAGIILGAVRESFACELAARRMAMDSASKNAKQMIDSLQLSYNRARQSAITQEITEIVAGSGLS